ncbi:MAG: hypothetical protein ACRDK3_06175 [Actinomycetota bacterium]
MTRRTQAILGVLLVLVGIIGVLAVGGLSAAAGERSPARDQAAMHEMVDAVHGPGTSARMHRVKGVEEMMGRCAAMMRMMDGGMTP